MKFNFNFRSKKGMTLAELLVGIAVSAVIMIATFTMVDYSFSSYSTTQSNISNDSGLQDTTEIINRYIREAKFCSSKDPTILYLASPSYQSDNTIATEKDVRFVYDSASQTLVLDRMDNQPYLIIAKYITNVRWEVFNNSVRYEITQKLPTSSEEQIISGFAYSRGR